MGLLEKINSPKDLKSLSSDQLLVLAEEIRQFLIENVSKTGGHLASNLGIVELTLGLHKTFNSPDDSFIFDVGHQSYVHKILTGRKDRFNTLRKFGGLSGFPKMSESSHDKFNSGHASNSISVAAGIAEANRLMGKKDYSVAILGDGALTGGLAFEALNNAGRLKSNLIVILNDNKMSISDNVGSLTNYLNRLRTTEKYTDFKERLKEALDKSNMGKKFSHLLSSTKSGIRHLFLSGTIFEALGFTYIGPIDGHDVNMICSVLESAKHLEKPVFIHAYTQKGKGYSFAEQAPHLYHGIGPFEKTRAFVPKDSLTYSKICGDFVCETAKTDEKIVAISAAMCDSTGLTPFSEAHKDRFFDVGISEGHAVTFAAGLSKKGFFPVVCIYSTFMQRAYDNIVHDLALQGFPALLCLDRAGLVGEDGETHHGIFDVAYLSHIPGIELFTPYSKEGLEAVLKHVFKEKSKLYAVRYPRGCAVETGNEITDVFAPEQLREGDKVTVVSISAITKTVKNAEFSGDHFHLNCIKPVNIEPIIKSLKKTGRLVTVEDNLISGGMGQILTEELKKNGFYEHRHLPLGIEDRFVPQGKVDELLELLGLDEASISQKIEEFTK